MYGSLSDHLRSVSTSHPVKGPGFRVLTGRELVNECECMQVEHLCFCKFLSRTCSDPELHTVKFLSCDLLFDANETIHIGRLPLTRAYTVCVCVNVNDCMTETQKACLDH